jgi:hypothetical protein
LTVLTVLFFLFFFFFFFFFFLPPGSLFEIFLIEGVLLLAFILGVLGRHEVVVFNSDIPDRGAFALSSAFVLSGGVEDVTTLLSRSARPVDVLHLVGHGNSDGFALGNVFLNSSTLDLHEKALREWRPFLVSEVLVYGCGVAQTESGRAFLRRFAAILGVNVRASTGVTGDGGDWILEFSTSFAADHVTSLSPVASWPFSLQFLTVKLIAWGLVGLDSNNVAVGPNQFVIGARVCATTQAATNVVATLVWDSANPFISTAPGSPTTLPPSPTTVDLAIGKCFDFYFNIEITRTVAAFFTSRRYRVLVTANGQWTISTSSQRQIYVEKFVSQNRNDVGSFTGKFIFDFFFFLIFFFFFFFFFHPPTFCRPHKCCRWWHLQVHFGRKNGDGWLRECGKLSKLSKLHFSNQVHQDHVFESSWRHQRRSVGQRLRNGGKPCISGLLDVRRPMPVLRLQGECFCVLHFFFSFLFFLGRKRYLLRVHCDHLGWIRSLFDCKCDL